MEAQGNPSGRTPMPIGRAAAVMLGIVIVVLGVVVLFVRTRPAPGPEAAPPPAAGTSATTATTVVPAATAAAKPQLTPSTLTTPAVTAAPRPTISQTAAPTTAPTTGTAPLTAPNVVGTVVLDVKVVNVNGTEVVIGAGTPTPQAAWWQRTEPASDDVRQALLAGYLHFWDVRANVFASLQPGPLADVMTGGPLRDDLAALEELRARNEAQQSQVEHQIVVQWASPQEGAVVDTLRVTSTRVSSDPTAAPSSDGQEAAPPAPTPSADTYRMAYLLRRSQGGTWQVVDSVQIVR